MSKYSLTIGYYENGMTFVVDDLLNVDQLYGAMHDAVACGRRLINVEVL